MTSAEAVVRYAFESEDGEHFAPLFGESQPERGLGVLIEVDHHVREVTIHTVEGHTTVSTTVADCYDEAVLAVEEILDVYWGTA